MLISTCIKCKYMFLVIPYNGYMISLYKIYIKNVEY